MFDCNCKGLNFQKEFSDAAQSHQRINEAIDFAFDSLNQPRPADQDLREALLADGAKAYEILFTKLFDIAPGCARVCTNTLLYIIDNAGNDIDESQFTELRSTTPPKDVTDAATIRRDRRKP
tara:strand:- start:101435 stop:101800 length:366 start_codon:yes stop_codon:yes gene_type:complete